MVVSSYLGAMEEVRVMCGSFSSIARLFPLALFTKSGKFWKASQSGRRQIGEVESLAIRHRVNHMLRDVMRISLS